MRNTWLPERLQEAGIRDGASDKLQGRKVPEVSPAALPEYATAYRAGFANPALWRD